jgi:hypothetical protein
VNIPNNDNKTNRANSNMGHGKSAPASDRAPNNSNKTSRANGNMGNGMSPSQVQPNHMIPHGHGGASTKSNPVATQAKGIDVQGSVLPTAAMGRAK